MEMEARATATVLVSDSGTRVTTALSSGLSGVAAATGIPLSSLILVDGHSGAAVDGVSHLPALSVAFDKRRLYSSSSSSSSSASTTSVADADLPRVAATPTNLLIPLPSDLLDQPLSQASLRIFSNAFASNLLYANRLVAAAETAADRMRQLVDEQRVQSEALRVALLSLQLHCKPACDSFDAFMAHTQKEIAKNLALIQSFPSDLQALHRIPIHPKISKSEESRFLSDYVPEEKLLLWADKCRIGHEEFVKKTVALSEAVKSLKSGTEMELTHSLDIDFDSLASHLTSSNTHLTTIRQTLQLLSRDHARVQTILQDLSSRLEANPTVTPQMEQTITALTHLQEIHTSEYIPSLTTTERQHNTLLTSLQTSKLHSTSALRSRLLSISHLQTTLSNTVAPGMAQLSQNLKSVSAAFGQLLHVHRMPAAWGAVIVEIVRRREFLRVWMERAERVAEGFGRVGEGEKRRREGFDEAVGKYLPKAGNGRPLVEGLEEGVPKVEVRVVRAGDKGNGLPILTRSDVAEFEQFISQIRAAMTDVDPSSSAAANTNNQHTILSSHSSAGNPADSISKLQATMTKMIPQLDSLIPDFDRAVARSGVCGDRVMKLEDENARLRAELNLLKNSGKNPISAAASPVTVATPMSMTPSVPAPNQQIQSRRIPVPKAMSAGSFDGDWAKAEETIKAYENRIRTLEDLLQRSYHMEKSNMIMNQSTSTGSDPALQQLQTENQTLKTRLALLESQFNTTSTSLQSKESRLKEAHAEREKLKLTHESERNVLKSRCSVLEKELNDLRHQLQEKDKEGRVVVGEVERCAGFVREVYELLDDCAGAFKIRGDESPSPQQEARLANQPLAVQTRGSSTASSLGKYQSPTSPSAGLMAIVNAATSFGSNPAGSSNPSSLSNIPRNNSNPVSSPLLQQPPVVLAILSNLRTDEREIRRRLRELQDDIRCQTLELVGVQDELAAIGAAASRNYDGTAESSAYESSNARYAEDVGIGEMSPRTEQSRSGISNAGGRGVHSLAMEELHASKREIQRLNAVVEELSLEVETARREAIEARERYEEMKEDAVGRESHISQLQDALGRLNEEKADWIETEGQMALKVERLTKTLEMVQAEKGDVERKLDSLGKEAAALQEKYSRVDEEWKAKWNQQSLVVQNWEGQVKAVNARLLQREAEFTEKLMDAEAVHTELNHTISSLQQTIADLDAHIHSTEAKYSSVDMTLRQKDGEISRLEETCEKFRLSLGREKGRIIKLKEKIEDWNVVCKMAMECLTVRFEALGSMGDALAEMDTFVDRFVKESLGLQANVTKLVGDEANPLKLKQSDLDSFKHAVNMASSMSNSIGEDHDFSAAADTKLSSPVELRDVYLNMIQLVDSVDISGWSDTVVRSCHNWKEMILTQSLRKAMLQGPKIAYTGFREGDLVLFLPTRNPKVWVAFNENAPHYFLSSASADTHFPTQIASKNWILAVVTNIEARKAGKPVTGMSTSQVNDIPLGLPVGTKYFWCTAVPLNK